MANFVKNKVEVGISEEREKRILDAVKNQTHKYDNKDFTLNWTKVYGANFIHGVSFIGEDDGYRMHYVYETGTIVASFDRLENLVKSAEPRSSIFDLPPDTIKTISLSAISLISVITICILAFASLDSKALEAMIAFAGLTIGYLAGKPA